MRVLLVAPDSKIPNLALMRLSTFHKQKGDVVGWNTKNPERIYVSIIFTKNQNQAGIYKWMHPKADIIIGGPGSGNISLKLPKEVENCRPDYSLYPEREYNIGRVTIGCPNKCYFCFVPKMECGGIRQVSHVWDFVEDKKTIRLIDDNIQADRSAWYETMFYLMETRQKVIFDAVDIRRTTEEDANLFASIRHDGDYHFAFDQINYEKELRIGVKNMVNAGVNPRRLMFYVYCHSEQHIKDVMHRWEVLRELGCTPFFMLNNDNITPSLRKIRRRACRPAIWRDLTTKEVFAELC